MKEHDVRTWPEDMRFLYEERAAIREYDGGQTRYLAEAEALRETWKQLGPKQGALAL